MEKYDAIIIGAGMSGMAAAIRLAMFDKKVIVLERHYELGGLNSFYKRGKRNLDVGLHALTNFAPKKSPGKPLTKLLKQLRLPYETFKINEQKGSQIVFPDHTLNFNNEIEFFISEIEKEFPDQVEGFRQLLHKIENYNETALDNEYLPAKEVVRHFITNENLLEMIFCPLLIYGSAWENDMDFSQFVIMFKSIFLEGFCRSEGGVRTIISSLKERMDAVGAELKMKTGVKEIISKDNHVVGVLTEKDEEIHAPLILSCAGFPETLKLTGLEEKLPRTGGMSFTETILFLKEKPVDLGQDSSIIFYNNRPHYQYQKSESYYDHESAVLCFSNNFNTDDYDEGIARVTFIANYDHWKKLERKEYVAKKKDVLQDSIAILKNHLPKWDGQFEFKDVFSPTTITRYTSRFGGAVYGSPDKTRDGRTPINGLVIMGTDQGFLGIIGSILSGISMANYHGLQS